MAESSVPKVDFKKARKELFSAPRKGWEEITIGPIAYLMVDGQGSPGDSPEYQAALERLYPAAFGIKFWSKVELGRDYVVPPLQGLWWADDPSAFTSGDRDAWRWTMMIMLPDWIGDKDFAAGMERVAAKNSGLDFSSLRRGVIEEGRCLQHLYVGPYTDEAPVQRELHEEIMPRLGLTFAGHHHEIYLGDPRRVAPEKLRTILRQPVRPL